MRGRAPSQALALVWLDACHGVRPGQVESLPMGMPVLESTADAVLVIGDRAMKVPHEPFCRVVDLAEAWQGMTGLPFVFALWVTRAASILAICRVPWHTPDPRVWPTPTNWPGCNGPRLGLDFSTCYDYLTKACRTTSATRSWPG